MRLFLLLGFALVCGYVFSCTAGEGNICLSALRPTGKAVELLGMSSYKIVLPENPRPQEKYSAELLSEYLGKIFDCEFSVINEPATPGGKFISIGRTEQASKAGVVPDPREQSYRLAVVEGNLFVTGGQRGPVYGAIALLEEDLGVRWFIKDAEPEITKIKNDILMVTPRTYGPPFRIREPLYADAFDPEWAAMNRLQPVSFFLKIPEEAGGGLANPKYFIHTYSKLVPAKKYFDTNPEFFPLRDGARHRSTPRDGQLCYTNDKIVDIIAATIENEIKKSPATRIYSVSANDNVYDNCECPRCQAIIRKDGVAGAQLYLANRVAEKLAKKYPDIQITTLAYVGSQKPTETIMPSKNTTIFYAPIRQRYNKASMLLPIGEIPYIKNEMRGWNSIASSICLWDYIDCIGGTPVPFPNFDAIDAGWKALQENGITGVFLQGAYLGHASLGELKAWLFAKKMWNPEWDQNALIEEFITGSYGPAAPAMSSYVKFQRAAWKHFYKNRGPGSTLTFTDRQTMWMRETLNDAGEKVADQKIFRERIEREQLTLLCLSLSSNPDKNNCDKYRRDLDAAKELISRLEIKRFGEGTDSIQAIATWNAKLERASGNNAIPKFSENSVVVKKPACPVAKYLPDTAAVLGHATRQHGGNAEWGVQWKYSDFLDLLSPGTEYIVRMRVRAELSQTKNKGDLLFRCGSYVYGVAGKAFRSPLLNSNDSEKYHWVILGKLKVENTGADGMLYCIPGNLDPNEAVWYDYLEFIPVSECRDKIKKRKFPLVVI